MPTSTARAIFTLLLFTLLLAFFFSLNMLAVLLEPARARKDELGLKSGGRESHSMRA